MPVPVVAGIQVEGRSSDFQKLLKLPSPHRSTPARLLVRIIRVAMTINLMLLFSELFTMFYMGGGHVAAAQYLFFGDHGKYGLVPWIWTSLFCNLLGTVLCFTPAALERSWTRIFACTLCLIGIWIEKGMGLIVLGFIPSTLHEVTEYNPSLTE